MNLDVVMEFLQWALVAFFTLVLFGALQRLRLLENRDPGSLSTLSGPELGRILDPSTSSAIHTTVARLGPRNGTERLVAFVSESCGTCGSLLAALERNATQFSAEPVLVAFQPSPGYLEAIRSVTPFVIADDGPLWNANHIVATPTMIVVDRRFRVIRKEIGSDLSQILAKQEATSQ